MLQGLAALDLLDHNVDELCGIEVVVDNRDAVHIRNIWISIKTHKPSDNAVARQSMWVPDAMGVYKSRALAIILSCLYQCM
jgi:hypothetical protein